jgi:hypothetical protein
MKQIRAVSWTAFALMGPVACLAIGPVTASDGSWPREVQHPQAKIVVYQPQIDDYVGTTLEVRSAVSVTLKEKKQPTFGAVWVEATTHTDRVERIVTFSDIKVTRVRFPGATADQEKTLATVIEDAAPQWDTALEYDRFLAGIAALRKTQETAEAFRNEPPRILVETAPAMLLHYDGKPVVRDIEGSKLRRVINTPSIVIEDPAAGKWFLYGGAGWLEATDPMGPWSAGAKPTPAVASLIAGMEKRAADAAKAGGEVTPQDDERVLAVEAKKEDPKFDPAKPPKVIPVTGPAELVVFAGPPSWKPLVEGEILYADNTGSDVLLETRTQKHFVLLSGRWYAARNLEGPWEFVPGDKLPATFAAIPEESVKGDVLSHVAGTPQADEAIADAQVPQVAAVKRGPAKLEVRYDGDPIFEKIEGTKIERARNASTHVLKMEGRFYACDQAVWYLSDKATGPWQVADAVPAEVQKIPPDSPAYNVKYVYVYDSTPDVVYVGYTPAYLGCYPYYGTVVWGTGYPYTPWIGSVYYPSPWSYGFHAHYNPWSGWSFGFSVGYSWGWGSISIGWSNWGWGGYHPPYWGPGGYYPVYRPPYYPGGYPPHYPGRPVATPYGGGKPSTLPAGGGGRPANIYDRAGNRDQVTSTKDRARPSTLPTRPATGKGGNNVYVNEAGDVYRRNSNGSWDKRTGSGWSPAGGTGAGGGPGGGGGAGSATGGAKPGVQPSTPGGGSRPSTPSTLPSGGTGQKPSAPSSTLQRDYSSRSRGSTRYGGYQAGGGFGGGGMPRGGGARRR